MSEVTQWENLIAQHELETLAKLEARTKTEGAEEERIAGLKSKLFELAKHRGLTDFLEARNGYIVLAEGNDERESASLTLFPGGSIKLREGEKNDVIFRYKPYNVKNQPEGFFSDDASLESVLEKNINFKSLTADMVDQAVEKGIQGLSGPRE
ncbi:MAG: hypothetical protein AAB885_01750 [Patescibacteria group bacterium]